MQEKIERLIKAVYKEWRSDNPSADQAHPDDQDLACFLEQKLSPAEMERIQAHLISCQGCAESIALQLKQDIIQEKEAPAYLIERLKNLVPDEKISLLEIFLKLKAEVWEIISSTGDIMVGQELVPAPVLRSRNIKEFKDEVAILKDFQDVRLEAKLINKQGKSFTLMITVKEKQTQALMKDIRITLLRDEVELESYLTDSGKVIFEDVLLGKYSVQISSDKDKLASILLDVKT